MPPWWRTRRRQEPVTRQLALCHPAGEIMARHGFAACVRPLQHQLGRSPRVGALGKSRLQRLCGAPRHSGHRSQRGKRLTWSRAELAVQI